MGEDRGVVSRRGGEFVGGGDEGLARELGDRGGDPLAEQVGHDTHDAHGSDMKAGFLGLIIGAAVLFVILFSIVKISHNHYAHETPSAQQSG